MADEDDRSGGARSAGGVELLVESVVRGWSTTSSGVFGGVCGRVVVGGGPRRCVGRSAVPSDSDSGVLGGSFRPAPHRVAATAAQSRGNRQAHPGCRCERSSRDAVSRSGRAPPQRSGSVAGVGEGGWCVTFGCAPAPARPGRGVIAPFRGGRGERDGRGGCGGGPARSGVHGPARGGEAPAGIAAAPEDSTAREYRGSGPPANRDPSRSES